MHFLLVIVVCQSKVYIPRTVPQHPKRLVGGCVGCDEVAVKHHQITQGAKHTACSTMKLSHVNATPAVVTSGCRFRPTFCPRLSNWVAILEATACMMYGIYDLFMDIYGMSIPSLDQQVDMRFNEEAAAQQCFLRPMQGSVIRYDRIDECWKGNRYHLILNIE